jgi:hypothetical protein
VVVVFEGFLFMYATNSDDGNALRSVLPAIEAAGIITKIFMPLDGVICHKTTI